MLRKIGRAICVVIRYQKHSTSKTKGYKLEEKVSIPPVFSIVVLYLILVKESAIDMIKYFI